MNKNNEDNKDYEDKLIALLISDNEKGLRIVYKKYYPLVYSFLIKESGSAEDSNDMAQDVFLKLWKTRHRLVNIKSLKDYLFIIARNTFIDFVRRKINQRVFEELSAYTENELSEWESDDQELIDELIKHSEKMPPKRLEVFRLRWLDGKSRKEISELLGISIVTVDIHLRKALDFLKDKVKSNNLLIILLMLM